MMKRGVALGVVAAWLSGCGSMTTGEKPDVSQVHFITFGPGVSGLVAQAKRKQLSVCLSGVAEGDRAAWAEDIKSTILKCVRPLRALTSDKLTDSVAVVRSGQACQAEVSVAPNTHSNASIGSRPIVRMSPDGYFGSYNVLLHEMGHAFALSDTYQNGQSGNCRPGQPQAVMCNTSFDDLQRDDIAGITRIFQQTFPGDEPPENPPEDNQAAFDKIQLAVALGQEGETDSYQIAVGLSGNAEQAGAKLELCLGSLDECKASESGWKELRQFRKLAGSVVFLDSASTPVSADLDLTVRYKNELGSKFQQVRIAGIP